ncbi:MAG TPA: PRC-barrel domain-containing protein [Chloroflexota bacterium]|nr:PRC-barrel domain-containing protein [Chloroflexota bacterium]
MMEFHIGAHIVDREGERVGTLKNVIVNPDTKQVEEIVLGESGMIGREVVVPVGTVAAAEADQIQLDLDQNQVGKLKDFVHTNYIAPEPGGFTGMPWAGGALIAPGIAPVGAAAGLETIAYTPIVETEEQIPEGDVDIRPGTEVWATDGKVGTVDDVFVDPQTNRVTGFVVKEGFIFQHDVEVSLAQISSIGSERIDLKVAKADLTRPDE